jgi:hypothetical protein
VCEPGGALDKLGKLGGQQQSVQVALARGAFEVTQPSARAQPSRGPDRPMSDTRTRASPRTTGSQRTEPYVQWPPGANRPGAAVRACSAFFLCSDFFLSWRAREGGRQRPSLRARKGGPAPVPAGPEKPVPPPPGNCMPRLRRELDTRRREAQPARQPAQVRGRRPRTTRRDQCRPARRTPHLATVISSTVPMKSSSLAC